MNPIENFKQTLNSSSVILRALLVLSLTAILGSQGYLYYKQHLAPAPVDPYAGLTKVQTATAVFYSADQAIKNKTKVTVTYIPPQKYTRIWLELAVNKGAKPVRVLLSHPQLDQLDWKKLETTDYTLFQKEFTYKSIKDFLENPPRDKKIFLDPDSFVNKVIPITDNVLEMTNVIDLDSTDIILARYHQPLRQDRYFISENIVNASDALVKDGKLSWFINIPAISNSDSWYIKDVKINYYQPK